MEEVGIRFVTEQEAAFYSTMERADRAVGGFADNTHSHSGRVVSAFSEIATGALRYVGEMAVRAFVDAGRAIVGFGADSVTAAGDFEATANRFSAVAGSAIEDAGLSIEEFSQQWLQLGADTQYSAQQAGDAAVELAKGGVAITDIMGEATAATLNLAAAAEMELAPAAEIVAKQLGVWAEEGVTATEITDLLAQAANASTVDVDELAIGLANSGGAARLTGLDYDELVTSIAFLAPGFSSASDAGTSFKTFLDRLTPSTDTAFEAMRELELVTYDEARAMELASEMGIDMTQSTTTLWAELNAAHAAQAGLTLGTEEQIEAFGAWTESTGLVHSAFFDAEGQFIGMEATMQTLKDATTGLSEEQMNMALSAIFGSDALRAGAMLAEGGAAGYQAMTASMDAAGTAMEQAALRNQGWNFAIETMKGSIETLQIVLGGMFLPLLTRFVQEGLTPAVNWLTELATAVGASETPLQTLLLGINTLLPGFSTLVNNILSGISIFQAMTEAGISPLTAGLSVLQATFPALTPAIETIRGVIETLTPIFQSVVATITNLQAQWVEVWPTIQAVLETAGIVIMAIIESIVATVAPAFATLMTHGAEFQALWQAISPVVGAVMAVMSTLMLTLLAVATGVFVGITNAITPVIAMFTNLATNVQTVATLVGEYLALLVASIGALFRGDLTTFFALWDDLFLKGQETAAATWELISQLTTDFVTSMLAFVEGLYTGVVDFFERLYNELVGGSIVPDMVRDILREFMDLRDDAIQFAQDLWNGIVDKFQGMKDAGLDIIRGFRDEIQGILDGIKSAIDTALGWIGNLTSALSGITFPSIPDLPFLSGNLTVSGLNSRATQPMGANQQMGRAMASSSVQYTTNLTLNQSMIPESVAVQAAGSFAIMGALIP